MNKMLGIYLSKNQGLFKAFCAAIWVLIAGYLLIFVSDLADSLSRDPNRCEIVGLLGNCKGQATLKIVRRDGILFDDVRGASKSQEVCRARGEEFYHWCGSQKPVTARFFRDAKLIGQWEYPAQ